MKWNENMAEKYAQGRAAVGVKKEEVRTAHLNGFDTAVAMMKVILNRYKEVSSARKKTEEPEKQVFWDGFENAIFAIETSFNQFDEETYSSTSKPDGGDSTPPV